MLKKREKKQSYAMIKGQAFEAYRVLIAMVIALAILTIILSAIGYFDSLRTSVSDDTLYNSWKSAVDAPNGSIVVARNLRFVDGRIFSRVPFAKTTGLEEECIQFDADEDTGFVLMENGDSPTVHVTNSLIGNVYYQCKLDNFIIPEGPSTCYAYCVISFGKIIEGESN